MKALVLVVAMLALSSALGSVLDADKPKHKKRHHRRDLCAKGSREVAGGQCCPKDHPVLIADSCYAHCDDGQDDMVLGSWVGCRTQCEPGYSSTLSSCSRGPLHNDRSDHGRTGASPTIQIRIKPGQDESELDRKYLPRFCKRGYVTVARRRDRSGGCCPSEAPLWIHGNCYAHCEQGFEDIVVGAFVGCRKNCPDGWDQTNNICTKSGEESTERGDFPREGVPPSDRRRHGRPAPPKNPKVTCPTGYVSVENSDSLCCPWDHSELIGALCYEECPPSYVGVGFGCRRACPKSAGWTTYPLTCTKWNHKPAAKTVVRKGWERSPVVPKQATSSSGTPAPSDDGSATGTGGGGAAPPDDGGGAAAGATGATSSL